MSTHHNDCSHDHGHKHHDHSHGGHGHHHHVPTNFDRAFAIGITLNLGFVVIEGLFGFISNSLSLLADAGHNFSDVFALALAWGASWLSRRAPSKSRTYGFGRSSILASLINAIILLLAIAAIAWSAMGRLANPVAIETSTVVWVALIGIAVNAGTAALFMRGSKDDINIRGAFLHMAADAAISLGVVIAALVIGWTGWNWLDPAVSLLIAAIIAISTYGLLRDSTNLALDAVPSNVDAQEIEKFLCALPGVTAVHDLHIWSLSTTSIALTAHLVKPESATDDDWLYAVSEELQKRFKIDHSTLQVETGRGGHECKLASNEVI